MHQNTENILLKFLIAWNQWLFVPMSPFHAQAAWPIFTKFCTDLHTNSGKVLNTSMTPPTGPLDPVPQTLKPKRVTGEKTFCNVKCPDGWLKLIKFFPGSAGARLASLYIKNFWPGSGRINFLWLVVCGLGQPFMVWVWILKISAKNVKFFNFFPLGQKKIASGRVGKYPGQSWVGLLFIAGQK